MSGRLGLVAAGVAFVAGVPATGQTVYDRNAASGEIGQISPEPPAEPSQAIELPGADKPVSGSFDRPAGAPAYEPAFPPGTPAEQREADPGQPVASFVEALQRAYWTQPRLLAERARLRSVDFRLPQARAQYGPQLQYSATHGYQRNNLEQPTGDFVAFSGWTSTASAILTQPLFTFGRLRANEDSARAQIAFGRASLQATEQQTLFSAINAYAAVLRDRTGVAIARDNVNLLAREFRDTGERRRFREATATEVQQVQTRLELARSQLLTSQRSAASSDAAFLQFVGAPAGELQPPNPLELPVQTLEEAYVYASANNPLLRSAYARERISRAELEGARAELLPRIDLQGRASYNTANPYSIGLRETDLRGSVTISGTIDSGIRQGKVEEASAANDADWRLIDAALRENRAELADAWNEWQTQSASIESLRAGVLSAQAALEGALVQERAGLVTSLDVLELARDLLLVRNTYNTAAAAAFIAKARVLAAMGALNQEYLLPDADSYDPEAHFAKAASKGDFPLVTPLVRGMDSLTTPSRSDRPIRDPAGPLAIEGAELDQTPVQDAPDNR